MHPILFRIGDFVIGTYGVAIVIGMMAGLWLCSRLARRRGLAPEFFYDLAFVLLLTGFIGARVLFIISMWDEFLAHPAALIFSREGFVFQGGFIAALACGIGFTRWRKKPLLEVVDIIAPGLVLAHAFGRIGCFLAGCCYGHACPPGKPAGVLCKIFSVQYPLIMDHGQPSEMFNFAYAGQMNQHLIGPQATAPLPILPVQLFESFGNFMICLALLWLWRRRKYSGQIFVFYMGFYSVLRFGLEFLRGDADRGLYFNGMLSTGQILAIFTLLAALLLGWYRHGRGIQPIPNALPTQSGEAEGKNTLETNTTPKAPIPVRSGRRRR
jgi:phosphatidylglycerol---prolipoprotein diacylglyceryl transferase